MFRMLIVSDSHHDRDRLERIPAVCRAEKVDRVLHLGDNASDGEELSCTCPVRVIYITGNCDPFAFNVPDEAWETVGADEYLMSHGHAYGVKRGLDALANHVRQLGLKGAFYGHTHQRSAGYVQGVYLLNPGALENGSACVVSVENGVLTPRFINVDDYYESVETI